MTRAREPDAASLPRGTLRQNPLIANSGGVNFDALGKVRPGAGVRRSAGEIVAKLRTGSGDIDGWVPFALMCALFAIFALLVPNYLSVPNLQQLMRDFAEPCMVALAMGVVIFAGGIDLSVGATFAIANFVALYLFRIEAWPLGLAGLAVLATGGAIGAINGLLVAYVRTRPFLTTLAMLLVLRAGLDLVTNAYTTELANAWHETDAWYFLGAGFVLGIPSNMVAVLILSVGLHILLTRLRPGLHIMATGADRRAARHAGVNTRRTTFMVYILSGLISALAGLFYAARQSSAGSDTGLGWEVSALAAVVLGGVSLAGGRGSVGRVLMGSVILFLLMSGLLRMNMPGGASSALIGFTLLAAVAVRIQWADYSEKKARAKNTRRQTPAGLAARQVVP